MKNYLLLSEHYPDPLDQVVKYLMASRDVIPINESLAVEQTQSFGLIIVAALDWMGNAYEVTGRLRQLLDAFPGRINKASLIVYSSQYWFTKRFAQQLLFVLNQEGIAFPGQSVFEILPDFINLKTWQTNLQLTMEAVWKSRILAFYDSWHKSSAIIFSDKSFKPKLLVVHASHHPVSNTLRLWDLVEQQLSGFDVQRMQLENGTITDCKGCSFKTCVHYAQNRSCYYGGQMTMEILPAIEAADIVIWVSPNYNDALSAMHAALINRLTVLYRRISFQQKAMYGVVVSGNSGCDSVACQLIGGLNINKGFYLPPKAILTAIASAPGTLEKVLGIQERARAFAKQIEGNHL